MYIHTASVAERIFAGADGVMFHTSTANHHYTIIKAVREDFAKRELLFKVAVLEK